VLLAEYPGSTLDAAKDEELCAWIVKRKAEIPDAWYWQGRVDAWIA